jgi:hypothetical protein
MLAVELKYNSCVKVITAFLLHFLSTVKFFDRILLIIVSEGLLN